MKIDTTTTTGKILLMQECDFNKKAVQRKPHDETEWLDVIKPNWNWGTCDFRLKPKTIEEASHNSYFLSDPFPNQCNAYQEGARFGVEWQKDQDNE